MQPAKKATEEMIQIAVRDWGIRAVIARPYTIIGRGEQREHLIPSLVNSCLWGQEMPFVESPVHDFVDVKDVVDALLIIAEKAKFKGEVYEIGTGKQLTNGRIREIVEKTLSCPAKIKLVKSLRSYDTKRWRAKNRNLRALGWSPKRTLKETIQGVVQEYLPM